ncbi:NADH-ubiquinone oxidoreductase 75 kDa subunit mitochondrial [Dissostichus eleginoides]|uniref:NADH-ubiquinone oxidoreductase 75 kDa subunit mitochondrial n=1 Tax=Dissostichus eleginoides TaxID=100907 RepID=A0AAD9FJQ1_DISEL|nr:NADH-ubiquinone oxidoreductase 75 kDa subunit mitochondrial [Dissostichus eleginoides]
MAARSDPAAHGSLFWLCTVCFLFVCVNTLEQATYIYSRMDLFDIGMSCRSDITADFHRTNNIPEDIARPPGSPWIVFGPVKQRRRRRERKQKRGCRAGLLARLRKRPHRPPSLFLANARSIVHKMDELEVLLAANTNVRDCCVMIITESWLHSRIPDAAVRLPGRSTHRYDRNSASAFRSGDAAQYSMARANLRRGIKAAKEDYKGKVEVFIGTSSQIQNDLISAVAEVMGETIKEEINSGVKERFVIFEDVTGKKRAEGVAAMALGFLEEHGRMDKLVAQCYDGAAVMASGLNGVQAKV